MANALEAASLVMIPSGYENGTLGSLKPTDGTGDFTFSRGSDISATRVNADGYIEKGYENLLLQSNSFLTTWSVANGGAITPNHSGYDGSNDAWYLYKNTGTTSQLIRQVISSSGVQTFSFYAKAAELEWIRFLWIGGAGGRSHFHLVGDGDTGTLVNTISTSIELIGDGWYKCSTTFNENISQIQIYPASGTNSVSGSTGGVYIQDAQLNQGLVAYPYVETTTAPVAGGILEDMPRLDYSGSCPALLLEPQRTNDIATSEYTTATNNSSISYNQTSSPEGYDNAFKIEVTGTNQAGIQTSNSYVSLSTTYTQSCYVKKDVGDYFGFGYFQLDMPISNNNFVRWNLADITQDAVIDGSYTNAKAEDAGNGWIRLSATITTSANNTRGGWKFIGMNSSTFTPSTISTIGDRFYLYGLQAEPNATYPTSYIPTYGTSQTRLADVCVDAGTQSLFNNDEGILYAEVEPLTNGSDVGVLSLRGTGSTATGLLTLKFNYGINTIQYFIYNAGVLEHNRIVSFNLNQKIKVAAKYSIGECVLYINGVKQYSRAEFTGFAPNTLQDVSFNTFSTEYLEARVNQVLYFPTALSDDECIELTTI